MDRKERARQVRCSMVFAAQSAPDEEAARMPTLYPVWQPGESVVMGDRRYYPNRLYKARQDHITQDGWEPDGAPALWEVLDVVHSGTLDDPIPAAPNMAYENGKYYSEDGTVYRCIRDTSQAISHMPSELIGIYFEVVG